MMFSFKTWLEAEETQAPTEINNLFSTTAKEIDGWFNQLYKSMKASFGGGTGGLDQKFRNDIIADLMKIAQRLKGDQAPATAGAAEAHRALGRFLMESGETVAAGLTPVRQSLDSGKPQFNFKDVLANIRSKIMDSLRRLHDELIHQKLDKLGGQVGAVQAGVDKVGGGVDALQGKMGALTAMVGSKPADIGDSQVQQNAWALASLLLHQDTAKLGDHPDTDKFRRDKKDVMAMYKKILMMAGQHGRFSLNVGSQRLPVDMSGGFSTLAVIRSAMNDKSNAFFDKHNDVTKFGGSDDADAVVAHRQKKQELGQAGAARLAGARPKPVAKTLPEPQPNPAAQPAQ